MRISDWSSDVCSSDLIFVAMAMAFLQRQGGAREIVTVSAHRPDAHGPAGIRRRAQAAIVDDDGMARLHRPVVGRGDDPDARPGPFRRTDAGDRILDHPATVPPRPQAPGPQLEAARRVRAGYPILRRAPQPSCWPVRAPAP